MSHRDFLDTFLFNYDYYTAIRDETPELFTITQKKLLDNRMIKNGASHMLEQLDIVAASINIMQSDTSHLGDAMNTWLMLSTNPALSDELKSAVQKRMDQAITPYHILAKMVMNKAGHEIPLELKQDALDHAETLDSFFPVILAAFEVEDSSVFPPVAFKNSIRRVLEPAKYWSFIARNTELEPLKRFCQLAVSLLSCPPSSAGIHTTSFLIHNLNSWCFSSLLITSGLERAFSSFGLVHTKLRNRLSNDRVMKLVRTYCYLRDKAVDDQDDLELLQQIEDLPEEADQVE